MSLHRAPRRIAALVLSGVLLTSVTACSGIPFLSGGSSPASTSSPRSTEGSGDATGDGGQSAAQACAIVQDTITQATNEFQNISAEDPAAVVQAMQTAAEGIAAASSQITNDQVAALLPSLQDTFQQIADAMGAIAQGDVSKLAEIEKLGTTFQETSQKFQELCAP